MKETAGIRSGNHLAGPSFVPVSHKSVTRDPADVGLLGPKGKGRTRQIRASEAPNAAGSFTGFDYET
jgi:hypothetical protein